MKLSKMENINKSRFTEGGWVEPPSPGISK